MTFFFEMHDLISCQRVWIFLGDRFFIFMNDWVGISFFRVQGVGREIKIETLICRLWAGSSSFQVYLLVVRGIMYNMLLPWLALKILKLGSLFFPYHVRYGSCRAAVVSWICFICSTIQVLLVSEITCTSRPAMLVHPTLASLIQSHWW